MIGSAAGDTQPVVRFGWAVGLALGLAAGSCKDDPPTVSCVDFANCLLDCIPENPSPVWRDCQIECYVDPCEGHAGCLDELDLKWDSALEVWEHCVNEPDDLCSATKRACEALDGIEPDAPTIPATPNPQPTPTPTPDPGGGCCKTCTNSKPCGDSCIPYANNCNVGPGCAC